MDLNDLYIGPKLQIETKYAAVLTLIFVDMTYSATMVSTETVRFMRNFFLTHLIYDLCPLHTLFFLLILIF